MALTRGVDPDSEFDDWLAEKLPSILDGFFANMAQFLWKEDAKRTRKRDATGPSAKAVQSNVAVKQFGDSFEKVHFNLQNKPNEQKKGGDRNCDRRRHA